MEIETCVVPENIHTPFTESGFVLYPTGNKNVVAYFLF